MGTWPLKTVVWQTRAFGYNPDQERDDKGRWAPSGSAAAEVLEGSATAERSAAAQSAQDPAVQRAAFPDSLTAHLGPDGKFTPEPMNWC